MVIPNTCNTVLVFIKVRKCDLAVPNETTFPRLTVLWD